MDFSEIRKEVAIEHNILIDKDDPALIAVTLNRIMFEKYVQLLIEKNAEQNAVHQKAIDASFQKAITGLGVSYIKLAADTGDYVEERMRTGLIDATKDIVAQHKKALVAAWAHIEVAHKTVIATAVVSCFCTIVSVAVMVNAVA